MNITIPPRDEMLQHLEEVDAGPHLRFWREQLVEALAGTTTDPMGVVEAYAATLNSANVPFLTQLVLKHNCRKYFAAFIDPAVLPIVVSISNARFGIQP